MYECNSAGTGKTCSTPTRESERSGYGDACTSSANACGETSDGQKTVCNADGTVSCDAETPDNPSLCHNNIGESGYDCTSGCTAPDDATISLEADPSGTVDNNTSVTYTATSTRDTRFYYIRIYEGTTQQKSCYSATDCKYSTSDSDTTRSFIAKIENWNGNTVKDKSSTVSTTWEEPCDSSLYTSCSTAKDFADGGSLSNMCGDDQYYKLTIPSGQVCSILWSMTPEAGTDYDLYVRWWSSTTSCATTYSTACDSTAGAGTNEFCSNTNLGAGRYTARARRDSGSGSYAIGGSVYSCKTITSLDYCPYGADTCFFSSDSITLGDTVGIYTRLTDPDGNGIANKPIELRKSDGTWVTWLGSDETDAQTNTSGYRLYSWEPSDAYLGTNSYQVRFKGDSSYTSTTKGNYSLTVNPPCGDTLSFSVDPTTIYAGDSVTLTASGVNASCGGKRVYFGESASTFIGFLNPPWTGGNITPIGNCIISGGSCSITHTPPSNWDQATYNAQLDMNGDGEPQTGEISDSKAVTINQCTKRTEPIPSNTYYNLPLQSGETCTVTVKHIGSDLSDRDAQNGHQYDVSFESLNSSITGTQPYYNEIGMDDDISSGCQDDITFRGNWGDNAQIPHTGDSASIYGPDFEFYAASSWSSKPGTHNLEYGIEVNSSDCVIDTQGTLPLDRVFYATTSGTGLGCDDWYVSKDKIDDRTMRLTAATSSCNSASSSLFGYDFDFEQCTTSTHCTDAAKPICDTTTKKCIADNPPNISIDATIGDSFEKYNPSLNIDATDDVALSEIKYAVHDAGTCSYPASPCAESLWKKATKYGSSTYSSDFLSVSGTSVTTNWRISNTDWNTLDQGDNIIYVRAKDSAGHCVGCDGSEPVTIKKDTLPPSSIPDRLGASSGRTAGPDGVKNTQDDDPWFKADLYSFKVDDFDKDPDPAVAGDYSGIDTASCSYYIYDVGRLLTTKTGTRTCNSSLSIKDIKVGDHTKDPTVHCSTEGIGKCSMYIVAKDIAGNYVEWSKRFFDLNIDRTAPRAE